MNIVQEVLCSHKKFYDLARKNIFLWQCYGLLRSFMFSGEVLCSRKNFYVLARSFLFSREIFFSREKFSVLARNFRFSWEILCSRKKFYILARNFRFSWEILCPREKWAFSAIVPKHTNNTVNGKILVTLISRCITNDWSRIGWGWEYI